MRKVFRKKRLGNIHEKTGRCRESCSTRDSKRGKKEEKAGYQENILKDLLEDMNRIKPDKTG